MVARDEEAKLKLRREKFVPRSMGLFGLDSDFFFLLDSCDGLIQLEDSDSCVVGA